MATVEESTRSNTATEQLHDDRLRAAVARALQSSGHQPLSELRCRAADGVVTVSGSVPTYYLKQLAQQMVLQLQGVQGVTNRIEVV